MKRSLLVVKPPIRWNDPNQAGDLLAQLQYTEIPRYYFVISRMLKFFQSLFRGANIKLKRFGRFWMHLAVDFVFILN